MVLKCDKFEPIQGIEDPRFKFWLNQIQVMDWKDHELWIYGGILKKSITRDIDASIVGPWDPVKIRELLDGMYMAAFGLRMMPDIKYQSKEEMLHPDSSNLCAYPPGVLIMEGRRHLCGILGQGNLRWKPTPISKINPPQRFI